MTDTGHTALTCQHCGHSWTYTGGKAPGMYVTCPTCHYKVRLPDPDSTDSDHNGPTPQ